jgi:hypothetical protein
LLCDRRQFIPSTVRWAEVGNLLLTQDTQLSTHAAVGGGAKAVLSVNLTVASMDAEAASALDMKVRAPGWAADGSALVVLRAGRPLGHATAVVAGSFISVPLPSGGWLAGDRVAASFVMVPRLKPINDHRPAYKNVAAIMMGPYVMAGLTNFSDVVAADPSKVSQWVVPARGAQMRAGSGVEGLKLKAVGANRDYVLTPLNRMVLENYTVYFNVTG